MRIDCHTHTARHSPCASLRPAELLQLAQARGIDAVVLTEHHHRWTPAELAPLRQGFPAMTVYAGVEISLVEGYDVVLISPELPENMPASPSLARLMEGLAPLRGESFLFAAHVFRYTDEPTPDLAAILAAVDGLEMNSVNIMRHGAVRTKQGFEPVNGRCYAEALERSGLIPIWNTDAHHAPAVGALATELPLASPPRGEAALAQALKETPGIPYQNAQLLERFLAA